MILFIKTLKREQQEQQQRVQATILTIKIYQLVLHCTAKERKTALKVNVCKKGNVSLTVVSTFSKSPLVTLCNTI